ncbi:MAG: hypothetical protein JW719_13515 [Pirellulales bacterium]|nr:hypothetical protein [Pirellulales bacterium]
MSVVLHAVLIVAVGLILRAAPPLGAAAERTAEVGIALKRQDGQKEFFVDQTDAGRADAQAQTTIASPTRDQVLAEAAPTDPSRVLPQAPNVLGAGSPGEGRIGDAAATTSATTSRGPAGQGKARVRVFGTEGEGYKFVYVFDRSGSMGGSGAVALRAAKAELLASLASLNRTHQFQIIFYNEKPWQFNPTGQRGRLAFGTDRNKELARRFVGGVTADGATRHEEALMMAIRMTPDVIFFLTDADEPRLSAGQIHDIARAAAGTSINAIEFGLGPQQDNDNFLKRLAHATGGQYRYVDVGNLKTEPRP